MRTSRRGMLHNNALERAGDSMVDVREKAALCITGATLSNFCTGRFTERWG
ncbi:MAG: hypothetical protein GY759_14735 [Chloroflexi bacterium]|nr:hypothetical protein [Chloroflexota bacterium]